MIAFEVRSQARQRPAGRQADAPNSLVTSGGNRRPPIAPEDFGERHAGSGRDRSKGFEGRSSIFKWGFRRPLFGLAGGRGDRGDRLAGEFGSVHRSELAIDKGLERVSTGEIGFSVEDGKAIMAHLQQVIVNQQ